MLRVTQGTGITGPGSTGPFLSGPFLSGPFLTGPALVRWLARLAEVDVPESRQVFADRLGQWLSWADAISLSSALSQHPGSGTGAVATAPDDEADRSRVRSALAQAVADDSAFKPAGMDVLAGFVPYRRAYHVRQQAMETAIVALRARLRSSLTARSPALARLAAVDAVMEQSLGARERSLLSSVPVLLERYFERLRRSNEDAECHAWHTQFAKDVQGVLLAELDLRLQPVEGLLDALRLH